MPVLAFLVGTNPLPTYVVIKYLLEKEYKDKNQPPPRIVLIGSEGVKGEMERLQERINTGFSEYFAKHNYKIKNPQDFIKLDLRQNLTALSTEIRKELSRLSGLVHLDFTPGRKTMSAFAVHEALKLQGVNLSYLDAGENTLRFYKSETNDVVGFPNVVSISFEDLFLLHGYRLQSATGENSEPAPGINALAAEIYKLAACDPATEEGQDFKIYQTWFNENFPYDPDNEISEDIIPWPGGEAFLNLKRVIREHFIPADRREAQNLRWADLVNEKDERKQVAGVLRQDWLTWTVYRELQAIKNSSNKITSLQAKAEAQPAPLGHDYSYRLRNELFDIAVLQGYRLTLIRCLPLGFGLTAEPKNIASMIAWSELKAAAFENLHRSRQWGGGEARFMLVTLLPSVEARNLENDLHYYVSGDGEATNNFRILGLGDIQTTEKLQKSLRNFLLKD